ncbi:MAG: AbrB/MazE/SpoVT family DNA-binding domain-containing protein [Nanoarchaeota archaeon]|nr:AbrB/MazE/SpoVT family DNA-binding domain-containing protein [Nanoarchaeota archaeon]MBU1854916.1 AbrB/MazE/SpoVT family DNA-binding domain-containing protein [Nanoarchaeota archaeon]
MDIKKITLSPKGQICIPKDMRDEVKFKDNEKLIMIADKNQIIIRKTTDFLKRLKLDSESITNMLLSENILKKDWDNEYDEQWNNV